jgi:hypothetical protein
MAEEIEEKRRYFRVHDTINLLHKVIDESSLDRLSHVSDDVLNNCSLSSALEVLSNDARSLLSRLERRDPELVEYLRVIDTKINLIAQAISMQEEQFSENDTREVVLSASGLCFNNEQSIREGQCLELRMLLTSCMAVIVIYGRVVKCRDISENYPHRPYSISVEFINLKEDVRELLIKHAVKTQLQQLRDKYHE